MSIENIKVEKTLNVEPKDTLSEAHCSKEPTNLDNFELSEDILNSEGSEKVYYDDNTQAATHETAKVYKTVEISQYPISEDEPQPYCHYMRHICTCALEIFILIFATGNSFHSAYENSVIFCKTSIDFYNLTPLTCFNVSNRSHDWDHFLESLSISSDYHAYLTILYFLIAVTFSLFLCPWSDIYGRKIPILLALLFSFLEGGGMFLKTHNFKSIYEFNMTVDAFASLTGGSITVFALSYSFAAENTSIKYRTLRYASVVFFFLSGQVVGAAAFVYIPMSDRLRDAFIYTAVLRLVAFLIVLLCFKEDGTRIRETATKKMIRDLFSSSHPIRCTTNLSKWRRNCGQEQLSFLIVSAVPLFMAYDPLQGISYSSVHEANNLQVWTQYTLYSMTFRMAGGIVALLVTCLLGTIIEIQDAILGIIGCLALISLSFGKSVIYFTAIYVAALSIGPFSGLAIIAILSQFSKIVRKKEYGTTFVFLSAIQYLASELSYFFFTKIDKALPNMFPVMSYMLISCLLIGPLGVFIWQMFLQESSPIIRRLNTLSERSQQLEQSIRRRLTIT